MTRRSSGRSGRKMSPEANDPGPGRRYVTNVQNLSKQICRKCKDEPPHCPTADALDFFREKNARVRDFSRRFALSAVLLRVGGRPARSSSSSSSAVADPSAYFSLCILPRR
jgi:hypothetical protein